MGIMPHQKGKLPVLNTIDICIEIHSVLYIHVHLI